METNRVRDIIGKLQAKADHANTSPEEASVLRAKIADLRERYGILDVPTTEEIRKEETRKYAPPPPQYDWFNQPRQPTIRVFYIRTPEDLDIIFEPGFKWEPKSSDADKDYYD